MFTRTIPDAAHVRFPQRAGLVVSLPLLVAMGITSPAFAGRSGPATPPPAANPAASTATSTDHGGGPPDQPPAAPPADEARVPGALPETPVEPPAGPPAGGQPATSQPGPRGAGGARAEAPVADTTAGERVVVCKYVRKPFVAEVAHHVVIVNEQALEGGGFTGSFPWAFSDGQFLSVAIRFAEDGEQAREVSLSSCPRQGGGTDPGGSDPGGTEPGTETTTEPGLVRTLPPAAPPAPSPQGVLPQTGAPTGLEALLLLSSEALLGGVVLCVRRAAH